MLRGAVLSRQSRSLVGRVHGNGVSAPAAVGASAGLEGSSSASNAVVGREGSVVLRPLAPQLLLSQSFHAPALQLNTNLRGTSIVGGGGGGKSTYAVGGRRGHNPTAAWSGVAAAAGGSLGARRSVWGRSSDANAGRKGGSDIGGESSNGFPETGGAADGDGWAPPPDAWTPDGAPPAMPQDIPALPGFDTGEGFSDSSVSAMDAVAAVPDVATTAVTATGLSAADLTMYPHHICMQIIDYVQATAGVPYWEAIVLVSVAAKLAVLPAVTTFVGMTKRLNMVKPQMAVHQERMQDIKNRMEANPEIKEAAMLEMTKISEEMGAMLKHNRIHIPKMFLSMFAQFPVFISIFIATRDMGTYFPGYMTGGFEWMPDLSAPDPTWTLPILTSASLMLLIELGSEMPTAQGAEQPKVNPKIMFRAMSIISVPIAFTLPSGVLLYWTTSNIFGMVQRGMLELRPVQKALGWPMPEDMPQPAVKEEPQEPREADSASKEDLERWGGGGTTSEASRGASEAAERAREAVAKASKARHEELKRESEERSRGDRRV